MRQLQVDQVDQIVLLHMSKKKVIQETNWFPGENMETRVNREINPNQAEILEKKTLLIWMK